MPAAWSMLIHSIFSCQSASLLLFFFFVAFPPSIHHPSALFCFLRLLVLLLAGCLLRRFRSAAVNTKAVFYLMINTPHGAPSFPLRIPVYSNALFYFYLFVLFSPFLFLSLYHVRHVPLSVWVLLFCLTFIFFLLLLKRLPKEIITNEMAAKI